jgi:hypothetical protein
MLRRSVETVGWHLHLNNQCEVLDAHHVCAHDATAFSAEDHSSRPAELYRVVCENLLSSFDIVKSVT